MLRWLASVWVVCLAAATTLAAADENVLKEGHFALPNEALRDIEKSIVADVSPAERARQLQAQNWKQFNDYFGGVAGSPSPGNLPTFFGPNPGPCAYGYANRRTTRCKGRICKLPASVKAIRIEILLWTKRVDEWFQTEDCNNYPGWAYLYNTDMGELNIGGIYLNIEPPPAVSEIQVPSQGFAPAASRFQSEVSHANRFRVLFTLSEIQVTLDSRVEIDRIQIKSLRFIITVGPFTISKDNVGLDMRKSRQPKSASQHAISFRSMLYFRANQACATRSPRTPTISQYLDTTCIYRSDKVAPNTRTSYYRGEFGATNQQDRRTETFKEGVVYDINLDRNSDETWAPTSCQFDFANQYATTSPGAQHSTVLGLYIDIGETCKLGWPINSDPCRDIVNWVLNDILLPAIIKDILCQFINGMFYPYNSNGVISADRGVINAGLLELYTFFRTYVEEPLSSKASAEYIENVEMPGKFQTWGYNWPSTNCATTNYCPYPPAVNFNTSGTFKSISLGLNNILGNVSSTPQYQQQGKLAIVEVIDILTGNEEGVVKLGICPPGVPETCTVGFQCAGVCNGDIRDELKLADYPSYEWINQPVFDGKIELRGMALYGVNSITRLKILDNGYESASDDNPEYTHTLKNSFEMQKLGLEFDFYLSLRDGNWVHRPRGSAIVNQANYPRRQMTMRGGLYIEVRDISLNVDLFMLLRADLIKDKKIGSIFGKFGPGRLMDRVRCAAFGLDAFQIARMQLAATLQTVQFQNVFGDLSSLIYQGVTLFNKGYRSATALYLPFLADNWARPQLNMILNDNIWDGPCAPVNGVCTRPQSLDSCPLDYGYHFASNDPNRYVNFYDSRAWNAIKGVVNDVVGGIPVRTGSASINTIIDKYLEWYIPELAEKMNTTILKLPNVESNNPSTRAMGNILFPRTIVLSPKDPNGNPNPDRLFEISQITARNLETIHELSVSPNSPTQPRKFRLDVKIGSGKIWDRFNNQWITNGLIGFQFHLKTEVTDVDELGDPIMTYAQDEADVFVQFGNITVGADIYALVNQNNFLDLTWGDLFSTACMLALVDDFELETLAIGFEQFRLTIDRSKPNWRARDRHCTNNWADPISTCPPGTPTSSCNFDSPTHGTDCGNPNVIVRFSDALDRLAWESRHWGATVDNMVKYIFRGIADSAREAANDFADKDIALNGCADQKIFNGTVFSIIEELIFNASNNSDGILAQWDEWSENQWNPRFPKVNPLNPKNTMLGSKRVNGPGENNVIDYNRDPQYYRQDAGFPAAQCWRGSHRKADIYKDLEGACWEDKIAAPFDDEKSLDLRKTFLVTELQNFLEKSGQKALIQALRSLSQTENVLGDALKVTPFGGTTLDGGICDFKIDDEESYCVDLDLDLDVVANASNASDPVFQNDKYIPGFKIYFKRLRVFNFHTFDTDPESFDLLQPYVPDYYNPEPELRDTDARFTLAHRLKFTTLGGASLRFRLDVEFSVNEEFLKLDSPTPDKPVTDSLALDFRFKNIDIQAMTVTAINLTRASEIPFFYFLDPFSRTYNCFFSMFYPDGLLFPQFQVYATDIIGPQVTVTGKDPVNAAPNIFSAGVSELLSASIEIFFQLIKQDLPDVTQGPVRSYFNRVLNRNYLQKAISAMQSPGSCPQRGAPCTDPNSWCHYLRFIEPDYQKIFKVLNEVVGGDPVKTSQLDINSLVDLGLNYSILSPTGPRLLGNTTQMQHPQQGDWIIPTLLSYSNGPSHVRITNFALKNLHSIYKLSIDNFEDRPYSLGFSLSMGDGMLLDGSKLNPTPLHRDSLILSADVDVVVSASRPASEPDELLAKNAFSVELHFSGINVSLVQEILVNKTDMYLISFTQAASTQCALAIIDKVTMETVSLQISDFDVVIPPLEAAGGRNGPDCNGELCNIGKAIDQLRTEALASNVYAPPQQSNPLRMLNLILENAGNAALESINKFTIWNQTREGCNVPKVILSILSGVRNANDARMLSERLANNVTGVLKVPMPRVKSDFTAITVQSNRLADQYDREVFIAELIKSAEDAKGEDAEAVIVREGSVCNELNLPGVLNSVCKALNNPGSNVTQKLIEWTTTQPNLIEEQVDPRIIESRVRVDLSKANYYDIRTSTIVESVTDYFDKNFERLNVLLENIANQTDILRMEADGSVSLVVNLTDAFYWIDENVIGAKKCQEEQQPVTFLLQDLLEESNWLIPRFRFLPGMLEIKNFGSFSELVILRPYKAQGQDARFTTRHEFGWRNPSKPLHITASIDLFYDSTFTNENAAPGIIEKETVNMTMTAYDLLVQVLTLLAVDTKELGEVSLGDFLNVDISQEFKRNCKAVTCLMKSVFDGGLYIPQLTVNVTNVVGPVFRTTGNLFTTGTEMLADAVLEIIVQLFKDDLSALTQGPLRETINDVLVETLGNAKKPGACPPRRNYTRDYPLGEFFCSHNDTTGQSSLLTQSEAICRSKYNGRACKWSPPDGEITENTVACVYTQEVRVINFQTSKGLQQLKRFVNDSLMNEDSAMYINKYLSAFASNVQTGMAEIDGFPLKYNGKEYGTVHLGIGNLEIKNLDTVDRFELFNPDPWAPGGDSQFTNGDEYEPVPPRRLLLNTYSDMEVVMARRELATQHDFGYVDNKYMSRTAIGWNGGQGAPLSIYFEILFAFDELFVPRPDGPQDFVENHIGIRFNLFDFDFAIDLFMLVNIPRLMDLQVRSIGTIYELPCILAIFEDNGLIPVQANITYGTVGFDIQCVDRCDSPFFSPLKNGGFSDSTSQSLRESFTQTFQKLTDFLVTLLASSDAQEFLDRQISISNEQCAAIKTGDITIPEVTPAQHANAAGPMGIVGLAIIFITLVGFSLLVPVHFRRRDELMKRALLDAHARGAQGKSKDEFELAERRLSSAFYHPMLPVWVKWLVPIMMFGNILCFATANATPGAIVELTLSIAGDTTYPITLLPFSLESSINDMWTAGVYPLAFMIAIASGGWPYIKHLMLIFSWFAPATVLHPAARGRLLEILDALGKWSMIDIYVLVMLMVGFRFYLTSSMVESFSLLPPDVLVVDVLVTPGWGFYGFVFGAMGSLLVNHLMIWHDRRIVRMDEDLQDAILGTLVKDLRTPRIPLSRHRFNILDAEGRPYRYSITVRVMVVFFCVLSILMLLIGCFLQSIKFEFKGLAGLAIAFIDQNTASATYSVIDICTGLIDGARNTTESILGIIFIQICFILFSLVLPIILIFVLIAIWVVPLTLREQILLYFVAEILSAWEAVAVLVVSFVAAVFQIQQLAAFIVQAATNNLCQVVEKQLEKIFPDPADAKCFNVVATLEPACAVLILASVLLVFTCAVVFRLIHTAIEDRELAMRRKPPHSPGEMTGFTGFLVRRSLEAFGASQIQNAGSFANLYAQGQGAFDPHMSQLTAASNPIMAREMPSLSGMQTDNPTFKASVGGQSRVAHMSIDV